MQLNSLIFSYSVMPTIDLNIQQQIRDHSIKMPLLAQHYINQQYMGRLMLFTDGSKDPEAQEAVQVYITKLNIMKKVNIFCHSFLKVKAIYYIDSLHRVKYFKPLFLEVLMIMAYR